MTSPFEPTIVRFVGELDAADVLDLSDVLSVLADAGAGSVVVDLGAVSFVDSDILNLLVRVQRRCEERGASLRVVGASGAVRRTFDLAGRAALLAEEILLAPTA